VPDVEGDGEVAEVHILSQVGVLDGDIACVPDKNLPVERAARIAGDVPYFSEDCLVVGSTRTKVVDVESQVVGEALKVDP